MSICHIQIINFKTCKLFSFNLYINEAYKFYSYSLLRDFSCENAIRLMSNNTIILCNYSHHWFFNKKINVL